ncbi:PQQ-binding-like beta-propeller repeat protein [Mycolicibacterium komossense]|uniref:outer membrane protein assembly factor BamB family protein n=1 Tax=Mycolicibacterium komossense TaxID=1779 RepID=UPI003F498A71
MLRPLRRISAPAAAALIAVAAAGCGNTDSWVDAAPSLGWTAQYGDAANSSYTPTAGADALTLDWTRAVKGSLGAAVAIGSGAYLVANGQTATGCSLMVWENDNDGRQRWCSRMVLGGGFAGPLIDGFDNVYVGQPGSIVSFPTTQWIRWRQQVIGMPQTPRILANGQLLVVTHLGQVLVFDAHRGTVVGTAIDLVADLNPTDSQRGLTDCGPARRGCPVAAAPAYSTASQMIVVGIWQPGAPAATLVGLQYHPGQTPLVTREWTSDAVTGGVLASPVLSADGKTVYVNGRNNALWALDASNGRVKWSVPLGFQPQTPPTVAPDGVILTGGGPDTALAEVKDSGARGELAWRRDDVEPLTTSSQAGPKVAYTVARDGASGMALLAFDPTDGHTLNRYPLPQATGFPVGVSISRDHRVVAATSDGQVYSFAPA